MNDFALEVNHVYQKYYIKKKLTLDKKKREKKTILNDINFKVKPGEFVTIVGPTGCGKSTLFKTIVGSENPYSGEVLANGKRVVEPGLDRGIVFQHYSLFPNLTVRKNVMFGLELRELNVFNRSLPFLPSVKGKLNEFRKRADEYLKRVDLIEHAEKYPYELSGGMRQRAAIAQAMIMKPAVILMDEPLGALDSGTREAMQVFILEQWKKERQTVLFVTHDLEEALFLSTRIIVLSQYYSTNSGHKGVGSKIVKDIDINWPMPRPTSIKAKPEFGALIQEIRREGLDPTFLQKIDKFDLRHK